MNSRARFNKYKTRFKALLRNPFFWTLTIVGNSIILVGSFFLYAFEGSLNTNTEYLDYLLWSMGTVTTIGYGSFTPQSFQGKITILFLMMSGTLFVWSYMAFLVTGLIAPELASLERDVHGVERELQSLRARSTSGHDV